MVDFVDSARLLLSFASSLLLLTERKPSSLFVALILLFIVEFENTVSIFSSLLSGLFLNLDSCKETNKMEAINEHHSQYCEYLLPFPFVVLDVTCGHMVESNVSISLGNPTFSLLFQPKLCTKE